MNPPAIGTREDQRTEFKRAEILRTPAGRLRLAREVVALLNGGRGVLWVGIVEVGGELKTYDWLTSADDVHVDSLKDVLVDRVEPRLMFDQECRLEKVRQGSGFLLAINVKPSPDMMPYCLTDGENRKFLKRHDDRTRPMNWSEIFPPKTAQTDPVASFDERWDKSQILGLKAPIPSGQRSAGSWYRFALLLDPAPRGDSEFSDAQVKLVDDPPDDVARRHAASYYSTARPSNYRLDPTVLETGSPEHGLKVLRIEAGGWLEFATQLEHLQWDVPPAVRNLDPQPRGVIFPLILVETTVSLARLAARIFSEIGERSRAVARLQLANARQWLLPPYAPYDIRYGQIGQWRRLDRDDATSRTIVVEWSRFAKEPDKSAFSLIGDVYHAFGLSDDSIPFFPGGPHRFTHSLG